MFQERKNLNRQELYQERLGQVWENIKGLLLSFDPKSEYEESKTRMDNTGNKKFEPGSCFPGIRRSLENLGEGARNILEQEIGPQEIDEEEINQAEINQKKKKNTYYQIEKICAGQDSPNKKIENIRYYMKNLASRLGTKLDEQGKELFPL